MALAPDDAIPDQKTGRPVVDQTSRTDESRPLWEQTGRPMGDQSDAPRSDEKKYRSRKERVPLGLRLKRELVRDIKVYCKVNRVNPQDLATKLFELFLSGKLKDFFRPADWSTTCSSSGSRSKEEEDNYNYNTETGRPVIWPTVGAQPLLNLEGTGPGVVDLNLGSKFTIDIVKRYAACHRDARGEVLREYWVKKQMSTGRWNSDIEEWLRERPKLSINCDCPECEGMGYDLQFLRETEKARPCSRCKPAVRRAG